ncbi:hypothetical protein HUT03_02525 [Candidatus Liberibacter africanus]|uniref:Lipoprotein n=1 Tax=Candidatus Liberibacter africanus PTSAPSY TaxID=1277257 RepID=A0A0G3I8R2_LIBAF|nr:hypothetical protein [Candidatus Liberibacter africanus]AKK20142.1 hypothetical protein G293_02550 [Candidatus Liberibacter africanus PTSAPSY]QTP63945.1 hypothetical protein HUT03_02525 [Candidatus Liberibacter africanus]
MLSKSIYSIFIFLTFCFFISSCKVYPLYYYNNKDSARYIHTIKISVTPSEDAQALSKSLNFAISSIFTKEQFQLDIVVKRIIDDSINNNFFKNTGRITLQASYSLKKIPNGNILYKNRTYVTFLFDFSNQKFAKMRTIQSSTEDAIQELADNIYLDVISFIKNIE